MRHRTKSPTVRPIVTPQRTRRGTRHAYGYTPDSPRWIRPANDKLFLVCEQGIQLRNTCGGTAFYKRKQRELRATAAGSRQGDPLCGVVQLQSCGMSD